MASAKKSKKEEALGGELTDYPNEKYRQFFEKFSEIGTLDVTEWKPVHILAYFCKKYEEQYQTKYAFKFNSPSPLKCFEVFQIKRLAMLLSSSPKILRDYIDWVYLTKVVQAKRRLTSISFMTHEGLVQDYKMNILLSGKKNLNVDRSTQLPANYRSIFQDIGITAQNYGDLAFLFQMEKTPELEGAFVKLIELGFEEDIIGRIV
jgi:hypothetical protein